MTFLYSIYILYVMYRFLSRAEVLKFRLNPHISLLRLDITLFMM